MEVPTAATPYLEPSPGIALLPVERHSVSFASLVRRAMVEYQPQCVALEIPRPLKGHFLDAIDCIVGHQTWDSTNHPTVWLERINGR